MRDLTSVMSHIKSRIEAFEFDPCVVGGELPVDLGLYPVSGRLPGGDFGAQGVDGVDAAVQALADHDVEFDLGDIQPTAVLGGKDKLEAVPKRLGPGRFEGFVERAGAVGVEVVHHQGDACGVGIASGDVVEEARPVLLGPALGHLGQAPSGQRFGRHEHGAGAAASILVVLAGLPSRRRRDRCARLADQLPRRLVHADDGEVRIVRTPINVEHLLHPRREVGIALRRDHPADAPPRFEGVFFNIRRTVSCETLSI